jgi:hypothetical protein
MTRRISEEFWVMLEALLPDLTEAAGLKANPG